MSNVWIVNNARVGYGKGVVSFCMANWALGMRSVFSMARTPACVGHAVDEMVKFSIQRCCLCVCLL